MKYDIRDLLGHWVKPKQAAGEMCPHACCKGRRVHPERFPVILPRTLLREAPERELWAHLDRYGGGRQGGKVGEQIVAELTRREASQDKARARRDRAKDRRRTKDDEFRSHLENEWLQAERSTAGVMLNRAGRDAGIDERSLFTGPESRVQKYASPELRRYFENHPRVSRSEFMGGAEAQRAGGRRRSEGNLLGISRTSSASPARPRRPAEPARGGDVLRKRRIPGAPRPAGSTPARAKPDWHTRVAPDGRGWIVVHGGKTLPGSYDTPRAAQGAMRKAQNAAAPKAGRVPRPRAPITPYADLF